MRKFDYLFLKNSLLPTHLFGITNSIVELKVLEQIRKRDYKNIFTKLESIAKVQSVKGSNAIENIVTTDKRIAEIVNQSSAPLNHNEQEIAGYRDALNAIHKEYPQRTFPKGLVMPRILFSFQTFRPASQINPSKHKSSSSLAQ